MQEYIMTIEDMKRIKKEKGYSNVQVAEGSGVSLGTLQKIFSGETMTPRYDTIQALEEFFEEPPVVQESAEYAVKRQGEYTVADYRALPDEQRVELIDGEFYDMAAPTVYHQLIVGEIHRQIANYIREQGRDCFPGIAPMDVQLDCDEKTMLQPDVMILCHRERVKRWGILGSPDFVLEVISPSTKKKDYTKKLAKYMGAGVREYWILDPDQEKLIVYFFESEVCPEIHGFEKPVGIHIFDEKLRIELDQIVRWSRDEW